MKKMSKKTTHWCLKVKTHIKSGQAEGYEGPSWCDIQEQACFASGDTEACMHVANFCWPG